MIHTKNVGYKFIVSLFFSAFLMLFGNQVIAQDSIRKPIGLIAGGLSGTYAKFARDIATAIDSDELRVLPILGKGSVQNVYDLISLQEVDIAIVQSDVLQFFQREDQTGGVNASIRYITKLYNEEVHIVAAPEVKSIQDLSGAPVAIGQSGSGTAMTSSLIFEAAGVPIQAYNLNSEEAIAALRDGSVKAAVFVIGKPAQLLVNIPEAADLHLLPLKLPEDMEFSYAQAQFSTVDYPGLVRSNVGFVNTISVGAVLAAYNWRAGMQDYDDLSLFTERFLDALIIFQTGDSYHPKWQEVDPMVEVSGWTRFDPAARWLELNN